MTSPRSKLTSRIPRSSSRSAIFDFATVFSAAVISLPATICWTRPMIQNATSPRTNAPSADNADRKSARGARASPASASACFRRTTVWSVTPWMVSPDKLSMSADVSARTTLSPL